MNGNRFAAKDRKELKKKNLRAWAATLGIMIGILLMVGMMAQAQAGGGDAAPPYQAATNTVGVAIPAGVNDAVGGFLAGFSASHPWVTLIFTIIGAIRFFMKPIVTAWHEYVVSTPSPDDDKVYTTVVESKPFHWGMYILDLLFSWKPKPVVLAQVPKV